VRSEDEESSFLEAASKRPWIEAGARDLAKVIDAAYEIGGAADHTAERIRVPAEKLGGAVNDEIGAEFHGLLVDGVASVLSTITIARWRWATAARRPRSTTLTVGFVGLSRYSALQPWPIAVSIAL